MTMDLGRFQLLSRYPRDCLLITAPTLEIQFMLGR